MDIHIQRKHYGFDDIDYNFIRKFNKVWKLILNKQNKEKAVLLVERMAEYHRLQSEMLDMLYKELRNDNVIM